MTPLQIRLMRPDEIAFVKDSWRKSFLDGVGLAKGSRGRVYIDFLWTRQVLVPLLERSEVWCAVEPRSGEIAGYAVIEHAGSILHYVFVKLPFRREFKIAESLIGHLRGRAVTYTHWTHLCERLPIPQHWTYKPATSP